MPAGVSACSPEGQKIKAEHDAKKSSGGSGEGIGTEPEVAARCQQQLMGTQFQQRRPLGDAQQLAHGGALAGAYLKSGSGKMLIFDGVMHVKTLI
jgi:hypothetical protein